MATLFASEATYLHGDQDPIDHTAGADIAAGEVVPMVDAIGIALRPIANGALGSLATGGVWRMDKVTELAITKGDTVYWDADGVPARDAESTAGAITTNPEVVISGGGVVAGIAAAAAALDAETVDVLVKQGPLAGDLA
jgi:predicted RecA/RadA family phage recombinase